MEQLKAMKEQITSLVQGQLANVQNTDTKELGEAIDMIKDLAEACYYCSITKAMEEGEKDPNGGNTYYYTTSIPYIGDRRGGNRMYYGGRGDNGNGMGGNGGSRYYGDMIPMEMYREYDYPDPMVYDSMMASDPREGRAKRSRRNYMESKELHKDHGTQMKDLEQYMKDLSEDVTEMIKGATPEEKQMLQQKIATLSSKIM